MSKIFSVSITANWFDCITFDRLYYNYTERYPELSAPEYSCGAYSSSNKPGQSDAAEHWTPAGKSGNRNPVLIIVFLVLGMIIVALSVRWYRRRGKKALRERSVEGVELGESDETVRTEPGNEHRPPQYTRMGKPGEIPPAYNESVREVDGIDTPGR